MVDIFLDFICNEKEYRLFSGCPCSDLKFLYDNMSSDLLYYIPALNEITALGIISGAYLSGSKGVVILDINNIFLLFNYLKDVNLKYKIPLLILTNYSNDINLPKGIECNSFSSLKDLNYIIEKTEKDKVPSVLMVKEGDFL